MTNSINFYNLMEIIELLPLEIFTNNGESILIHDIDINNNTGDFKFKYYTTKKEKDLEYNKNNKNGDEIINILLLNCLKISNA